MGVDRHSLDGLGVLGAVVEAGSFVRAGEALGLTQSAVSRAVARLEERIGVRLFRRTARSISLTDEGRLFYESVAPHLAAIVDATTEAGGASTRVRGRLRVNVDGGIGPMVLMPRLQPFLAQHPDLDVEFAVRDRMGDLVREGFDVSVRFGVPEPSALKSRLLMRTRVVTCASPAYLARHGMPRHPRDIEKHQCVLMRDPSTGTHFGWDFVRGKKVVPVNVSGQLMVNEGGSVLAACLGGQGIAQLLELYTQEFLAAGQLVQVLPEWAEETYPLYAYHHSARLQSAKVRAFLDFVVALTREPLPIPAMTRAQTRRPP
ncbi:LysR family transcriptional regulator [Corallococcus llansteffanensis]|uniref:LysR family transcriptional regulator n=1 Tax=Corallococcus llansteffanensis TaxID=2316731 RepID=A0A3A8PX66_9BACT|nr:LysR family transcriptional regulator [Corallococcus llansteffanensis]RKH59600.1 LysR family transcriptional regulator [Corallococcus llansteffanensis]